MLDCFFFVPGRWGIARAEGCLLLFVVVVVVVVVDDVIVGGVVFCCREKMMIVLLDGWRCGSTFQSLSPFRVLYTQTADFSCGGWSLNRMPSISKPLYSNCCVVRASVQSCSEDNDCFCFERCLDCL